MNSSPIRQGLPGSGASLWFVQLLGLGFLGLAGLFILAPGLGSAVYGLPIPEPSWIYFLYVVAVGLRDLAFGLYLLILSRTASLRTLAFILAATLVIPIGDMVIILIARGFSSPKHLLLHGLSAMVMAAASLWFFKQSSQHNKGGFSS